MKINKTTISKNKTPLVSIVMPVFNAGPFLAEAIESILTQTYKNFEFIIVDDASDDNSYKIIQKYARYDKRIRTKRLKENCGISRTVKYAIDLAKGQYIARMDADDIAYKERLQKQLSYLKTHPNTVACGTQCILIDKDGKYTGAKTFPLAHNEIYKYIFMFIPVQQPTLMINRKLLPKDFVYYEDGLNTAEEVELFFKLFKYGKVVNLPDTLHAYRIHGNNISLKNVRTTFLLTLLSRIKAIAVHGYRPTVAGVITTLVQTIAILVLPQKFTLSAYKFARQFIPLHTSLLAFHKLNVFNRRIKYAVQ